MAAGLGIRIFGDAKQFNKAVEGAQKKVGGFGKALGAIGGAFAGAQVIGFGKDALGAATDVEESISKSNVVFGKSSKAVQAWADGAAVAFGQSKGDALEAAGTFGNFFKTIGLGEKEAAGMSEDMVMLASDLASFNNADPTDVVAALGAAMRGEAEPMAKFGVLMNDAALKDEAVRQGLIKTTKEALTPQQKALAAQALIMAQTTSAQGDFARTSDGLANTQRTLSAQFEDLKAKIGEKLIPIVQKAIEWFRDLAKWAEKNSATLKKVGVVVGVLTGIVIAYAAAMKVISAVTKVQTAVTKAWSAATKIAGTVTKIWSGIQAAFNVVMSMNPIALIVIAIAALIAAVVLAYTKVDWFRAIVDKAWQGIQVAVDGIVAGFLWVWERIKEYFGLIQWYIATVVGGITWLFTDLPGKLVSAISGIAEKIFAPFKTAGKWVKEKVVDKIVSFFTKLPGRLVTGLVNLKDMILAPFKVAFNALADLWNKSIGKLSFTVPSWVPGIGGKGFDMPDLPKLHQGGTFRSPPGMSEGLALLRDGERVLTPGSRGVGGGARGVVVNVNVGGSVLSEKELIKTVRDALIRDGRRGYAVA